MEGSYRFLLTQGDTQNASKMAASILQYSVQTSQQYAEQAAKQLYDGNLKGAVDNINHASDAVPDGRLTHVHLNDDGTAIVVAKGLDGRVLWQQKGSAEAILQYATNRGRTGQMQWDALEDQAAKYDPTFRDMAHNRALNANAQAKEDAANASAGRVAATGAGNPLQPVTRVGNAPAPTGQPGGPGVPASATDGQGPGRGPGYITYLNDEAHSPVWHDGAPPTPTSPTQGAPPSPNSAGAAQPNAAPQGADSNAPYQPSDLGGAPTQAGPAIPPQATPAPSANVPAAQGQDVSFDQIASRLNNQEAQANASDASRIRGGYFTPQGNILYGGQEYARPPEPDMTGLNRQEQAQAMQQYQRGPLAQYNAMLKANQDAMNKDIADNRDIRNKQFQTLRDQARDAASERGRRETFEQQDTRAGQRAIDQSRRDAVLNTQKDALDKSNAVFKSNLAGSTPRSDQEMNSLAGEGKTYDPAVMMARAFNPDLSEDTNRTTAMNDLKQKGFDANTQGVLANAWHNTVRNSHGVDPEEVGPALQSFITGGQFTATAESMGPDGRPMPQHGDVRYALTVEDNSGNHISMLMSQNDLANLRNLRLQYTHQQQTNLAANVRTRGLPALLGAPGYSSDTGAPPNVMLPSENPSMMGP